MKKAKRMLAGLCVALMLMQSVGECTLTAVAAGRDETPTTEETSAAEETLEGDVAAAASFSSENTEDDAAGGENGSVGIALYSDVKADSNLPSQDGDDVFWGDSVTVKKEGDDFVIRYTSSVGTVEVVGRMDSDGVVTIDKDFNMIYDKLFEKRTEITELRFAEGAIVKSVGNYSFQNCVNLKRVDFSNCPALTQIGAYAFSGCSSLAEVKFHDNLQTIYRNAFEKCALESVTLVSSLNGMGAYAFQGCKTLEHIRLEASNLVFNNGSSYIFNGCHIRTVDFAIKDVSGDNSKNNIIVPRYMFQGATFATDDADFEFLVPCEIQEIGANAFESSNLSKVTFEDTTDRPSMLSTISDNAFKGTKITSITFPATVQTLGASSFEDCTGLTELVLPNTITALGNNAFKGCKNIGKLQLSNATTTVGSIGSNVFANCTSLTNVELPEGLTFTGNGEFKDCTNLSSVKIPSTMEKIGDDTFWKCAFTQVELPDSVTILGKNSFRECPNLITIKYSESLTEIQDNAFKDDRKLTSNVFPKTLTKIGASAFENCVMFKNLTIPENVTDIGGKAFSYCSQIDHLTIESNQIVKCGDGIFNQCLVRTVKFPDEITTIPARLFDQARFTTDADIIIPNTVITIGDYAFAGTSSNQVNLPKITFEKGTKLTKIGAHAFEYCTALESFEIPDTTEEIGANAFAGCIKISSIVIPENVTKIGTSAFSNCSILSDITYNAIYVTTNSRYIFDKCNVKKITIGPNVEAFPANLFRDAQFSKNDAPGEEEMVTIYVPASMKEIGEYALPNIANLQQVVFQEGSMLDKIGNYAFSQCVNLESMNLPDSVTTIGNNAFEGCEKLGSGSTKFSVPASLATLGSNAFKDCPSLTEVVIPSDVTKISDRAFMNDTGLTAVQMVGGSLTEIGVSSFEGCTALTEVSIPNGVTKIGATAFKGCSALTRVVIPESVTNIGKDAFAGCNSNILFLVVPGSYAEEWLKDNKFTFEGLTTITYELDGGLNAPTNPAGYEEGDTFLFAPATRKGYAFKGWYLEANFQTEIKGVEGCTGNITIYAKWEKEIYTITYVLDGGVNHKDNPATYTISDKVELKNPTKEGFTFEGWYSTDPKSPEFNPKSKVNSTIPAGNSGDRTLYAKWNGGTAEAPTASIESGSTVKAGTKVFLASTTPGVKIYYTLDETEPTTASTQYSGGITIDRDLTVKAVAVKSNGVLSDVVVFTYSIINEATFWGDILPEDQTLFADATKVPKDIWVAGVEDVDYSGQKITFSNLRVYDGKNILQEKTDYTVKYSNNTKAADKNIGKKAPAVTITAKGNYKGKVVVNFTIRQLGIDGANFTTEDMAGEATGKLQKPVPVLYYGKTKLKIKRDYDVEYFKISENGSESVVYGCDAQGEYLLKLKGKGNFGGERTVKFDLRAGISVAKAKIIGLVACDYTGNEITQNFTVQVGGAVLSATDYDVVYSNNVNAGTATVKIVGKGNYCGMKKATFKIKPIATLNQVSFAFSSTSVDYTGSAYEIGKGIEVTANYGGSMLEKNRDYTCTYKNNKDAGTATITFTGMGGYSGTTKKTFKIVGRDLSSLDIKFLDNEGNIKEEPIIYPYEQGGVKPSIQMKFNGVPLVAGKDYTLSYKNNTTQGEADITIKGKKNFKGTFTRKFKIEKQNLENLSVFATDVVYKNSAGVVASSKPIVTDINGKTLVEGTDYKVTYRYADNTQLSDGKLKKAGEQVNLTTDIIPVETTIIVEISNLGMYTGKKQTSIKVCRKSIASAKVTVKPQTYTGSEIQPGTDQITVKVGGQILSTGDYEIVGYTNNIKKGTAKVTIRGVGNYGGAKIVNFRITQKTFVRALLEKMFN